MPSIRQRPSSLQQVLAKAAMHGNIDAYLREFLDEFYLEDDPQRRTEMLAAEPSLVEDRRTNAYLAAVAEHLALRNKLEVPSWCSEPARFLKLPYFPCGLESLKATLLVESPTAFRRRLIFVGADPLYRPRRDAKGIGGH